MKHAARTLFLAILAVPATILPAPALEPVQWSNRPAQSANTLATYPGGGAGSALHCTGINPAAWDSVAVGSQIAWSAVRFEFQFSQADKDVVAGLAYNNTSPEPAAIRFGIYAHSDGTYQFNEDENRIDPAPAFQGYSDGDGFAVERSGDGTVRYFKGAQLIRTTSDPPADASATRILLQPDVAFLQPGAAIENAMIDVVEHAFPGSLEDHVNGIDGAGGLASPIVAEFVALDDATHTFDTTMPVEVINVRDPGPIPGVLAAAGNGTEEDTAAIQSALDRAAANDAAGKRTVLYFPPGIYDCAPDKARWAEEIAKNAATGQTVPFQPVAAFKIQFSNFFLVGENPANTILRFHTYDDAAPASNDLHDPAANPYSFVNAPMGKTCVSPAGGGTAGVAPNPDGTYPHFRRGVLRGACIHLLPPPPTFFDLLEGIGFRNLTIDGQAGRTAIPWPDFPGIAVDPYEGDPRVNNYPWLVDGDGWDQTHQAIHAWGVETCVMLDCVLKRWRGEIIIRNSRKVERPWVLGRCTIEDSNSLPLSANGSFIIEDCDIGRKAFASIETTTVPGQRIHITNTHLHGGVAVRGVSRHPDSPAIRKDTPTFLMDNCTIDIKTTMRFDGGLQNAEFARCQFGIFGHDITVRNCTFNVQGNQSAIDIQGGVWPAYNNALAIAGNNLYRFNRQYTNFKIHNNVFDRRRSAEPLPGHVFERGPVLFYDGSSTTVLKRSDMRGAAAGDPDIVPGLHFHDNTLLEETGAEWLAILDERWRERGFTRDAEMAGEKAINNVSGPGDPSPPPEGFSRWIRFENNITPRPGMVQHLLRWSDSLAVPELPDVILPAGASPLPRSTEVFARRTGHDAVVWINGVELALADTLYRIVRTQQTAPFWGRTHILNLPVKMPAGTRLDPATPFMVLPGSVIDVPAQRPGRQNQFVEGFNYSEIYLASPQSDTVELEIVLDEASP